jgi:hypothetical protein
MSFFPMGANCPSKILPQLPVVRKNADELANGPRFILKAKKTEADISNKVRSNIRLDVRIEGRKTQ